MLDEDLPPRVCSHCGAANLPLAPKCTACWSDLEATPQTPRRVSRTPLAAMLLGLVAILVASSVAIAAIGDSPTPPVAVAASPTPPPRAATVAKPAVSPARTPEVAAPTAEPTAKPTPRPKPTPTPKPGTVELPTISAKVSGASTISYYSISGTSTKALYRQMVKKGSSHCEQDALACVRLSTAWVPASVTDSGTCRVTSVRTTLRSNVWLPRWTAPSRVSPRLVAWWRKVIAHIAWHEGRHIKIAKEWMVVLKKRVAGHSCASTRSIVAKWARDAEVAQQAFDRQDQRNWHLPVY
jgi:predicted secreted Zn-dependent protease